MCLLLFMIIALSYSRPSLSLNEKYNRCSQAFLCGNLGSISYPFYDGTETRPEYCGQPGFKVHCFNGNTARAVIRFSDGNYFLQGIDYGNHTIRVSSTATYWDDNACPQSTPVNYDFAHDSSSSPVFSLKSSDENMSYYSKCKGAEDTSAVPAIKTNCSGSGSGYYLNQTSEVLGSNCKVVVTIPILKTSAALIFNVTGPTVLKSVRDALRIGFDLGYSNAEIGLWESCTESGGECGYDWEAYKFVCYCPDQDQDFSCPLEHKAKGLSRSHEIWPILKVVVIVIVAGILANLFLAPLFYRTYKIWRIQRSFSPKRYSYSSIKKMTNSFKEKLGEGGYGPVYKGKLEDGRLVAVKLWKQSSGDGQEFLNEVASISRTNHANIVVLYGFCFEGHKQALVYEFMPNGSLEKFLNDNKNNDINQSLPMETLFKIAAGVARGLHYLHLGCDTRILHFDIKPHNILLDSDFTPKISDFGMARSCTRRKSTISMSAARGTAGYIAPEVFFRNYGGVSYKSDVYSFGMMLLEIVGQRKNQDVGVVEHSSSELYFPQWIYTRLEQEEELVSFDGEIQSGGEEDQFIEKKLILVGLWCIQTSPLNRPSMSRVVEMLRGKLESLCVPPMPSLSLPPRPSMGDHQTYQYCSTETSLTLTL